MRWFTGAGLGLVVALALIFTTTRAPEDTLERVRRSGVIRVGYAPEAPFAFRSLSGEVTGESPEIVKTLLRRLGVERIEWVQTEWAALIPDLNAGRFDVIGIGMFVTCERAEQVAFTEPTYQLGPALLVRKGNPKNLRSYAAISADPNARLAVVSGAAERDMARRSGIRDSQILAVPDAQTGLAAVATGRVDALTLTSISIAALATADPTRVERAAPFEAPTLDGRAVAGHGALAVRSADQQLLGALNGEIRGFVGSAEHRTLVAPFGFTPQELPEQSTAAILRECAAAP